MKMKRVLILMVMLVTLCLPSVIHAESNEAAQVLIGQYQDMRLNCEAGVNYYAFCDLYRSLYVATGKQQNNMDKVTYDKFMNILSYYEDAADIWDESGDSVEDRDFKTLNNKYPNIETCLFSWSCREYNKKAVVRHIMGIARGKINELEKSLKTTVA